MSGASRSVWQLAKKQVCLSEMFPIYMCLHQHAQPQLGADGLPRRCASNDLRPGMNWSPRASLGHQQRYSSKFSPAVKPDMSILGSRYRDVYQGQKKKL